MNTEAPLQVFKLACNGDTQLILMHGTFRWELEYEALTGGSYQRAVLDLDGQLTEYRLAAAENRPAIYSPVWARCTFDLFYASCAQWRASSGWDRTHTRPDDEGKPERQTGPYLALAEALGKPGVSAMQSHLIHLLYAYNFDPGAAGAVVGKARRPAKSKPAKTTQRQTSTTS